MNKVLDLVKVCFPCFSGNGQSDSDAGSAASVEYVVQNHYVYKIKKPESRINTRRNRVHSEEEVKTTKDFGKGDVEENVKDDYKVFYYVKDRKAPKNKFSILSDSPSSLSKYYDSERKVTSPVAVSLLESSSQLCSGAFRPRPVSAPSISIFDDTDEGVRFGHLSKSSDNTLTSGKRQRAKKINEFQQSTEQKTFCSFTASEISETSVRQSEGNDVNDKYRNFKEAMSLSEPLDDKRNLIWNVYLTTRNE